jgi:hypothetical protein
MDNEQKYKCYNCGYIAVDEAHLKRHKNRKTPCLIRDVKPEDIKNPNRCIYCNKIFSTISNLKKHHGSCKVKNGGMQMLHDKVKYEETMRIMQEEHNEERKQNQKKIDAMMDMMKMTIELQNARIASQDIIINELRTGLFAGNNSNAGNNNNTGSITGDHNTIDTSNTTNNLTINNYNNPSIDHIKKLEVFAAIFRREMAETPIALVEKIWYDPEHPENSALHLVNKKNGELLVVVGGRWITENASNIIPKIRHLVYELTQMILEKNQAQLIDFSNDMVPSSLEFARKSERVIKEDYEAIMKKMVDGRKVSQIAYDRSK